MLDFFFAVTLNFSKFVGSQIWKVLPKPTNKILVLIFECWRSFFVKEIQEHLLDDQIDIAVHSLKDLPVENYSGDVTSIILERGNHCDVFLSRNKKKLSDFDHTLKIGTSSLRRKAQLLNINPDLNIYNHIFSIYL